MPIVSVCYYEEGTRDSLSKVDLRRWYKEARYEQGDFLLTKPYELNEKEVMRQIYYYTFVR